MAAFIRTIFPPRSGGCISAVRFSTPSLTVQYKSGKGNQQPSVQRVQPDGNTGPAHHERTKRRNLTVAPPLVCRRPPSAARIGHAAIGSGTSPRNTFHIRRR